MTVVTRSLVAGALVAGFIAATPGPARADEHTEALGRCFVAATTESDRIAFVRWMFMAIAKHPEVADLARVPESEREEASRQTARLVERLALTNCRAESAAVLRHDGVEALGAAFEMVGDVAAEGLMAQPAVAAQFEALGAYVDESAWEKFTRENGI